MLFLSSTFPGFSLDLIFIDLIMMYLNMDYLGLFYLAFAQPLEPGRSCLVEAFSHYFF